jgi:hypothetical protein
MVPEVGVRPSRSEARAAVTIRATVTGEKAIFTFLTK